MVKKFTGKDVNEATGLALQVIGVKLEDLDIKVINPGRSGILGFGGEHAEIEVSLISGEPFEDELVIKSNERKIFKSSKNVTRRKKNKDIDKVDQVDPGNQSIKVRDGDDEKLIGQLLDYFLGAMGVVAETFVRDDEEIGSLIFEIDGFWSKIITIHNQNDSQKTIG